MTRGTAISRMVSSAVQSFRPGYYRYRLVLLMKLFEIGLHVVAVDSLLCRLGERDRADKGPVQ